MIKAIQSDPKGRVDLLMLNVARLVTERLERTIAARVGGQVSLWPHVEPLVQGEIRRRKIPARSLTPIEIVGLVSGKRPRRLKCTG